MAFTRSKLTTARFVWRKPEHSWTTSDPIAGRPHAQIDGVVSARGLTPGVRTKVCLSTPDLASGRTCFRDRLESSDSGSITLRLPDRQDRTFGRSLIRKVGMRRRLLARRYACRITRGVSVAVTWMFSAGNSHPPTPDSTAPGRALPPLDSGGRDGAASTRHRQPQCAQTIRFADFAEYWAGRRSSGPMRVTARERSVAVRGSGPRRAWRSRSPSPPPAASRPVRARRLPDSTEIPARPWELRRQLCWPPI